MIKGGSAKLPLDRAPGLAKALDCGPAMLSRALEQLAEAATSLAIDQIFGAILTENEADWLTAISRSPGKPGDARRGCLPAPPITGARPACPGGSKDKMRRLKKSGPQ